MGEQPHSRVNKSELIATFTDYDEGVSPVDGPALRIRLSADVLFVYPGKLKEELGVETFTFNDADSIGIDAEALYEALGTMLRRSDRNARERAMEGTLPADHPTLTTIPTVAHLQGVRRRA